MVTINYNYALSKKLNQLLANQHLSIAFAETFTGGAICQNFTAVTGASDVLDRSYICYSKSALLDLLQIPQELIHQYGIVSEQCSIAMAQQTLKKSHCHIALSATGVSGPAGGTTEQPIGTVWVAIADRFNPQPVAHAFLLDGGRKHVRRKTIQNAFIQLIDHINKLKNTRPSQIRLNES